MKGSHIIRAILIFFGVVLLANQVFNYLYIRKLDKDYIGIVEKESQQLQSFEIITIESSDIQRALLNIAIAPPSEYKIWQNEINQSQERIDSQFAVLSKAAIDPGEKQALNKLESLFIGYKTQYSSLLTLLLAETTPGTHQNEKIKELGKTYEYYMTQQEKEITFIRQNAENESEAVKTKSYQTSTILLFVGTMPYLLFICTLIISLVVVLWLGNIMNWFRHSD